MQVEISQESRKPGKSGEIKELNLRTGNACKT